MGTRQATIAKCAVLGSVGLATFLMSDRLSIRAGQGAGPPDEITLTGVARDFHATHDDFGKSESTFGQYAGTVDVALTAARPTFNLGGYRVVSPWLDSGGREIAPHLFGVGGGSDPWTSAGVRVRGILSLDKGIIDGVGVTPTVSTNSTAAKAMSINGDFVIDGDALVGPGGDPDTVIDGSGTITGTIGAQTEAFAMPAVVVPTDAEVGPNTGHADFSGASTYTISSNMHTDDFRIRTDAVVRISGNIKILVEGEFRTETGGSIVVPAGSTLDIYCTGSKITVETKAAWSDPSNTRMWVVGSPTFKIQTESAFYGTIIAPDASLLVQTKAELFGSYIGNELQVKTEGKIHISAGGGGGGAGCLAVSDSAGAAGAAGNGWVTSVDSFAEWFADDPRVNQSAALPITMIRDGAGVYTYASTEFFPIDKRLFGKEGASHNYDYTYVINAEFTYDECGGQFIEFEGGDGAWAFVDGNLVLDIGGLDNAGNSQIAELDRVGLIDGETYAFNLFYAQRSHAGGATFRLRTNVLLTTEPFSPVPVTAMFD